MNYSPYAKNKYATNLLIFMFIFKGIREIASLSSRITTKNKLSSGTRHGGFVPKLRNAISSKRKELESFFY